MLPRNLGTAYSMALLADRKREGGGGSGVDAGLRLLGSSKAEAVLVGEKV